MLNKTFSTAFSSWAAVLVEKRMRRHAMARVLAKMSQTHYAMAFERWLGWMEELGGMRTKLRKCAQMRNRGLAAAFTGWAVLLTESKDRQQLLKKVVLRIQNAKLARVYHGWLFRVEEMKKFRFLLGKGMANM